MLRRRLIAVPLLLLATACGRPDPPATTAPEAPGGPAAPARVELPSAPATPAPVPPAPADSLFAGLDDRALAGQMIVVYRAPNDFLLRHGFGGVLLFKSMLDDPRAVRDDLAALQAAAPLPYLVALDQEGGAVSRLDALPGWEGGTPGAPAMAAWPVDSVRAEGRRIGRALADLGVNLNLAPVLDSADAWDGAPSWLARRGRAFGRTAQEILPPALAFASGCREAGVACLAKHFPGYDVATNSDLEPATSGAGPAAIEAGVARFAAASDAVVGVMMASIIYPPLGDEPAVLSPRAVALARRAVGGGLVMTDDLWGTALRAWQRPDLQILPAEYPDRDWAALVERALRAGNDLLLVTYPAKAVAMQEVLVELMAADPEARDLVAAAARRILLAKREMGLLPAR